MKIFTMGFVPPLVGALVAINLFLILKLSFKSFSSFRMKLRRIDVVRSYQIVEKSALKRTSKQLSMTKLIINSYGDRVVQKSYRSKLEKLLVNSGDWENKKYSSLVQRKILFAISGFSASFLLLALKSLQLAPLLILVIFTSYFFPDAERYFHKLTGRKYRSKLTTLLDQAGSWKETDYYSLVRKKINFGLTSFVLSYLFLVIKNKSFGGLLFSIAAVFFGFFLPDLLLQNKVLKRKEMLANNLPDAIDMLQMCVSAGLAFPAALSKVAETQNGPVAEEFARVTAEVQLGQARSDALAAMAERTQEKHVKKFVSAMMQVDRFGIPVGNVLIEQSHEMRSARRERARERGQKVPVKILAPIMLCFLPTVLLIVLGPAVISIMRAFGHH